MTFEPYKGIEEILSASDESQFLWRSLLQAIQDHGGDVFTLNCLLRDTRGDRSLLNCFAKKAVGRIWEIKDLVVDLGAVDFACGCSEFMAHFKNVHTEPSYGFHHESRWKSTLPKAKCKYTLIHFSQPKLFEEIVKTGWGPCVEPASWRELVAYASKFQPEDFGHCNVVAPGSMAVWSGQEELCEFPRASNCDGYMELSKIVAKQKRRQRFSTQCFYLVRVYDMTE